MDRLSRRLEKSDLLNDLGVLIRALTTVHPDPYSPSGGPLEFHRQVAAAIDCIPRVGMSAWQFLRLIRPIVASIGDSHTMITVPKSGREKVPRLWLQWETMDRRLFVSGVYRAKDRWLIGHRLEAVDDVPWRRLLEVMASIWGCESVYANIDHLSRSMVDGTVLQDLISTPTIPTSLNLLLTAPSGREVLHTMPLETSIPSRLIRPRSSIRPFRWNAAELATGFLPGDPPFAYLGFGGLLFYREAFERAYAVGPSWVLREFLPEVAKRTGKRLRPNDRRQMISLVPSATETIHGFLARAVKRRARAILVDLRHSWGGDEAISLILAHQMFGQEGVRRWRPGYDIPRFSRFAPRSASGLHRREINPTLVRTNGGYDFSREIRWRRRRYTEGPLSNLTDDELAYLVKSMPTFAGFFHRPVEPLDSTVRVIAVTSGSTFSAGYHVAAELLNQGAATVGVPPAQAGNCFTEPIRVVLPSSNLRCYVSTAAKLEYPTNPELGRFLKPQRELTFEDWSRMDFDPNAGVRLAMEYESIPR